jgi:hypothetical protein
MSPLDSFLNTLNPSSQRTYLMTAEVIAKSQGGVKYPTYTVKGRKANWIGQGLRRNRLQKHIIQGYKWREDED